MPGGRAILNAELVPILQTAVGPFILISGTGLLLLTMSNRLARTIDRARAVASHTATEPSVRRGQMAVLWRRARLQRASILLLSANALCAAFLVILLFVAALLRLELAGIMSSLFIIGMAALIGSLALFILEVNHTLSALQLELREKMSGEVEQ